MPSDEAIAACQAVGLDPALLTSEDPAQRVTFTTWIPDTHPELSIDFLSQNGSMIPIRVANAKTGKFRSKIPGDKGWTADDGNIDSDGVEVMRLQRLKNSQFLADMALNFPGLDFSKISFTISNGKLIADLSAYTPAQQLTAKAKLALTNYADKVIIAP